MIKKDTYLLENIDYEVMFENAPVAIGFTKDRRFIKCNARFELLFGYEPDGVVGLPGSVVHLDQDDYYEFGKQVGPLLSKGATVDVDKKFIRKDGSIFEGHIYGCTLDAESPTSGGTMWVIEDVTERVQYHKRLVESESQYRLLSDNQTDYIFLYNRTGDAVYISPSFLRLYGVDSIDHTRFGLDKKFVIHPDDTQRINDQLRALVESPVPSKVMEYRWKLPSGGVMWVESNWQCITDQNGAVINYLSVVRDVTKRHDAEQNIREMQKLDAIGQLTGGLAHDFNNLLGIVVGNLDMIEMKVQPDDSKTMRWLELARNAALKGAEVTRSLLAVARRQSMEIQRNDINEVIKELLPLVKTSCGSSVTLRSQIHEHALWAFIDSSGLSNVILNLAINARDAMHDLTDEKTLTIVTKVVGVNSENSTNYNNITPGQYACVEVTDTGTGMNGEVLAHAFEPFYTTKERGKGTGLGLPMVFGYAKQLGGTCTIDTEPGAFTTVRVYLPLSNDDLLTITTHESDRVDTLHDMGLLDTAPEEPLDTIVKTAAQVCDAPIALISLVDSDRQWFKAKFGLEATETPRDVAFCAHAIHQPDQVLVVPDASLDTRFSANQLVLKDPKIRFYAGVPLLASNGHALGTLCVIDHKPHDLDVDQLGKLEQLAKQAEQVIDSLADRNTVKPFHPEAEDTDQTMLDSASAAVTHHPSQTLLRILIVDDEVELCDLAEAWFQSMGCETQQAHNAKQALDLLAETHFDMMFTDIVMPGGVDGIQLAQRAKESYPELAVALASGYAQSYTDNTTALPGPLLNKPYRKNDLEKLLRDKLNLVA